MMQFLRETWELWYWALFRPSLLQARINTWAPQSKQTGKRTSTIYSDILLFNIHVRFLAQFVLLLLILCIPIFIIVAATGEARDWIFVVSVLFTAYGLSLWFLPVALQAPVLFALVYAFQPATLRQVLDTSLSVLPSLPTHVVSVGSYTLGFILASLFGYTLWRRKQFIAGRVVLLVSSLISIAVAGWLAGWSWPLIILLVALIGFLLYVGLRDEAQNNTVELKRIVAFGVVVGVVGMVAYFIAVIVMAIRAYDIILGVLFGVVYGIAGIAVVVLTFGTAAGAVIVATIGSAILVAGLLVGTLAGMLTGLPLLPFLPLLFAAWLAGVSLAPMRWPGLVVAGVFAALSVHQWGLWALAVGGATLAGSYRLLPFYPLLALISSWRSLFLSPFGTRLLRIPGLLNLLPLSKGSRLLAESLRAESRMAVMRHSPTGLSQAVRTPSHAHVGIENVPLTIEWLRNLPPNTDEILWIPLPGHGRLLVAAFHEHVDDALAMLQQMRALPYPGYRRALQWALLQIVADQLTQVRTIDNLVGVAHTEHLLSRLVPTFYQRDEAGLRLNTTVQATGDELATLLPRLLLIADNVGRSRDMTNPALIERGLERCLTSLHTLQGQLPGLGLSSEQLTRWQPIFSQWATVLHQVVEHQRTLSQGEIRNPFQTGNPLRPERKELFKGRTQFVGDLLRYVYDASRPTLVMHGPRRCGKSSFLLNLPRLLPSDVLPVYYSLQTPAATASTGDFCYGLVRAMGRDLRGQGVAVPEVPRSGFQKNPYGALEDWLDTLRARIEQRSVLLCFDEFEKLGEAIAQARVSMAVFDQLRDLIQHSSLSFLFCGVQTLNELGPNWSSYFISAQPMEMTYLEPEAACELLMNPDPSFDLRYAERIVEQVVAVTRCHPYLLQLIGEQMVRQANRNQTRLLTDPLLETALDAALTAGEPYFINLWTEYTGTTSDEVRAGQALLYAIAQGQALPSIDTLVVQSALRRLVRYHVIEPVDDGYRCEVPLVARWVRERAVLNEA